MNPVPVSPPADRNDALAEQLRGDSYNRLRIAPPLSDIDYLLNCDLRDAIARLALGQRGRTLDFGCGGSPYREMLPDLRPYVRADMPPGAGLDLVLDPDGLLPREPAGSYDVVLSTQVLEHVPEPARYLAEAYRLLRPGGALILTTHGFMPEHGCPYDFQRWTSDGLAHAVTSAGFVVEDNYKLTLDRRAFIYYLNYTALCLFSWPGVAGYFAGLARKFYRRCVIRTANWLGDKLNGERIVPHGEKRGIHQASIYIGVALRARKPLATGAAA